VKTYPGLATEIEQMQSESCRPAGTANLPVFAADPKGIAGRDASGKVLNVLAQNIRGSWAARPTSRRPIRPRSPTEGAGNFQAATPGGKNLHFGIREHAMGAIVNGMSACLKLRSLVATFFIFSDYARPASALRR